MAIQELTSDQIQALVGARHAVTGMAYPAGGLQPYYQWLVRTLHLLSESSAGGLRAGRDDSSSTAIYVASGRAVVGGALLEYAGGAHDLAAYNNDTAYVWLYNNAGVATIGYTTDAAGWPAQPHIKIAEVTLSTGDITAIVDRRGEQFTQCAHAQFHYALAITQQGSTATPTSVQITLLDAQGAPAACQDYLRVRICDATGYAAASNATLAAAGTTTTVETLTGGKDLVVRSSSGGVFDLAVTDATAETIVLRLGTAPLSARVADRAGTLSITHA